MNIQAVIFDLDGVIVSTDSFHFRAWKQLADEECIYFDENINNRLRGVSRMESLNIILEKSSKTYSDEEKCLFAERKNNIYVQMLQSLTPKDILPGVLETLARLRKRNLKLAIGSSSKNAKLILNRIQLPGAFDCIADGNDVTRSKPFPDVFLTAAEKLRVKAGDCLVVEDAVAGIQAAKAAGMLAAAVGDALKSSLADYRLSALQDLISIICT